MLKHVFHLRWRNKIKKVESDICLICSPHLTFSQVDFLKSLWNVIIDINLPRSAEKVFSGGHVWMLRLFSTEIIFEDLFYMPDLRLIVYVLITWLCEINLSSLYKHRVFLVNSTGSLKSTGTWWNQPEQKASHFQYMKTLHCRKHFELAN